LNVVSRMVMGLKSSGVVMAADTVVVPSLTL